MSDRKQPSDAWDLPPELAELDRELSSFRIEERASFGPELASELAAEYARTRTQRPRRAVVRRLAAAAIAVLFLGTLAVPPARGALARFLVRVQEEATEVLTAPEPLAAPFIDVEEPTLDLPAAVPTTTPEMASPRIVRLGAEPGTPPAPANTPPDLENRWEVEELVQSLYPRDLMEQGVGGEVRLLIWVDDAGVVEEARVGGTSGVAALDRAALATAPYLKFVPGRRMGAPVGSWVQFDVRFEPLSDAVEAPLPSVSPVEQPAAPQVNEPDLVPEWMITDDPLASPPVGSATQIELLREAMGDDSRGVEERWGTLEGLLAGEAPVSSMPLRWRSEAAEALEEAIVRDPQNPAPFLALGRIRRRQGLRVDARRLFERGVDRAEAAGDRVPASVAADLYYERGTLVEEDWLPWMTLGQVHGTALGSARCDRASSGESAADHVSSRVLIAWNYLCPSQFDEVLRTGFEPLEPLKHGVRDEMLRSYYAAAEVHPGHPGANVAVLLSLADARAYEDLLEGAQRFALASSGHPHALLLSGLALHRLGRAAEARTQFGLALQRLPSEDVEALTDPSLLLGREAARGLAAMGTRDRAEMERRFWAPLDPLLATPVNEREVEHLARATYAMLRFGGTDTDAGRVWIRYGRPNVVRTVREGAGLRNSFWDYGPGPDVTFRRPAASLSYELTEEGRAYVEELMDVFPHRYDSGRGRTLPVVSQTARFRSDEAGVPELEIHARIPAEMLTGPKDSLELGLYVAGPGGERWVVTRRRVPAVNQPVHLTAVPTTTSDRVILELYHASANRAARLEFPVARDGTRAVGPALSDLLLTEPVSPFRPEDAARGSSVISALPAPSVLEGREVGLVFEVYGVGGRTARYGLTVEAESLENGEVTPLAFKPAGELEFREDWDRVRRVTDRVVEYVTVDASGLPGGQYLLRVAADPEDGGSTVTATRVIDVR